MIRQQKQKSNIQECFRVMRVQDRNDQIFVPACIQFKIRNFTDVNFENLTATVSGVLCINFLIFTQDQFLRDFLTDRLYFNKEEQGALQKNRRKRVQRGHYNFVPLLFNKDWNVKLPTTRTSQYQIQSFKTTVLYRKNNQSIPGIRIFHIIRKQFNVQITRNGLYQNFFAPFDFINLELLITLQHMDVGEFKFLEQVNQQNQQRYLKQGHINPIKRVSFNLLRIEQPYRNKMGQKEKVQATAPMIAYSSQQSYGKYDVVETQLQAYTHDERELPLGSTEQQIRHRMFEDSEPNQVSFKPFKYSIFKIPLFRYPVVDMITIFVPLWLLSFTSVYIYFQTTQILGRVVNVAALMIAYAAIQPIVRQNLPEATTITLVDILIYSELLINILFLIATVHTRWLIDSPDDPTIALEKTNLGYDRWQDGYFLTSLALALANVAVVAVLIVIYFTRKGGFKAQPLPKSSFSITERENWTLTLLMDRSFARYYENLIFLR